MAAKKNADKATTAKNESRANQAALAMYAVFTRDGELDEEKSVQKFQKELRAWNSSNKNDLQLVAKTMEDLFLENPNVRINSPALVAMVFGKLGGAAGDFQVLQDRVAHVIKTSPKFKTVKGKGGGVEYVSEPNKADAA